jgi:hypothetical protein
LPGRYDDFPFLDRIQALQPLREVESRMGGEVPETFPSGVYVQMRGLRTLAGRSMPPQIRKKDQEQQDGKR